MQCGRKMLPTGCRFAYRYGAKIFVTLNTILHDDELEPAQRLSY